MREILFRAKAIRDDEWVEGVYQTPYRKKWYFWEDSTMWYCYPETVGQFTGLTDKNGNKIFEGDILKNGDDIGVVTFGIKNCGCCHDVFGFAVCDKDGDPLDYMCSSYNEIIGNIFDNPELLENK